MKKRRIMQAFVFLLIITGIILLSKNSENNSSQSLVKNNSTQALEKAKQYPLVPEIPGEHNFINSLPFKLQDIVGKKIILVDFWTYSCINCQRTIPQLNEWYKKYSDQGLLILGVHTPEFEFEKDYDNVKRAVDKFGIKYPVVQDNNQEIWNSFSNRYWPRKYLVDIDGFIVYDHIGEGGYEETEKVIQLLLKERAERMGIAQLKMPEYALKASLPGEVGSPEVYFGSSRNSYLQNGPRGKSGLATFSATNKPKLNSLYLNGTWNITPEYAQAGEKSQILFTYAANDVYMVASSSIPQNANVRLLDSSGTFITGTDVLDDGTLNISEPRLYHLIHQDNADVHTLQINVPSGTNVFTFTFG